MPVATLHARASQGLLDPVVACASARFRPLLGVEGVTTVLDLHPREVYDLVEWGRFSFVWDIRTPGAELPDLRIWRRCVDAYGSETAQPTDLSAAWADILPTPRHLAAGALQTVRSTELRRALNCGVDHVCDLIHAGCFGRPLRGLRRGRGGEAWLTRSSVIDWLASRRS